MILVPKVLFHKEKSRSIGNKSADDIVYLQRVLSSVKTYAQPRPLSSYMTDPSTMPGVEIEVSVPVMNLPGMDSSMGFNLDMMSPKSQGSLGSQLEAGAAAMLQVDIQ